MCVSGVCASKHVEHDALSIMTVRNLECGITMVVPLHTREANADRPGDNPGANRWFL